MIRYKIVQKNMTTHKGHAWVQGIEQIIDKPGTDLCSDQVFHFYDTPAIAVFLNVIHANYTNYVIWAVDCDEVAHDGLKGGAKRMTLQYIVPTPVISLEQRVTIAIKISMAYYHDAAYHTWATAWLSGKDKSAEAAAGAAAGASWVARVAWSARAAAEAARAAEAASVTYLCAGEERKIDKCKRDHRHTNAWSARTAEATAEAAAGADIDDYRILLNSIITEVLSHDK